MIKAINKLVAGAALVLITSTVFAQHSGQLGSFDFLPQSVYANPALKPEGKLNIGIPFLSNVYMQHENNWFSPKDYLLSDGTGQTTLDATNILDHIDEEVITGQSMGVELIHIGIKIKKHYIHFRAAERAQFGLKLPRDIFEMAVYGNIGSNSFENNTADFSNLSVDGIHYREYGIGYNYEINDKWSVGLTAKYLYGMERIQTVESSLQLRTDPNTYELQSSGTFAVNTSGIYGAIDGDSEAIQSNTSRYVTGLDNSGFGGDIGVVYKPIEKLQLEISANDLGFIHWKSDVANYNTGDAGFAYNGINLTNYIFDEGSAFDDGLDQELDSLGDALENTYNFDKTEGSFKTSLNGYMRYAATWHLYETKNLQGKVWANVMHGVAESQTPFSYAIGYNQKFKKNIQASVHYSKRADFKGSFGGGLVLASGPVQFYFMAESIQFANLTKVDIVDSDSGDQEASVVYFSNPADIRINLGINLVFHSKKDKRTARPLHK